MTLTEVKPGDWLYLEESMELIRFKSWERPEEGHARIVKADGSEGVYPVKGVGYTFHVLDDDAQLAVAYLIGEIADRKQKLRELLEENAKPL